MLAHKLPTSTAPMWAPKAESASKVTLIPNEKTPSSPQILHIVTSRFMQLQSELVTLGKARLQLFETFCFPSMLRQDVDNFVWFLMVDPNLDKGILRRLETIMSPHPNFFVVLMNNKLVTPQNLTDIIKSRLLATGDPELLSSAMLDTQRPLLLETRLDADDALNRKTLRRIQEVALALPDDREGWQVICNDIHFEWRNDQITILNSTLESAGQLRAVTENMCITAGYTLVRHRKPSSIDFPSWPAIGHHLITRDWPKCMGKNNHTINCWTRLPRYPAALRSRTITSAGMNRVQSTDTDRFYDNQTELLWTYVERDFGISREEARETSKFLRLNLRGILEDNLQGQW